MPAGIEDRNADCWESLLAIADAAGGSWPQSARAAAVALVQEAREAPASLGLQLLADVRAVFGDRPAMLTRELLAALNALEESPWGDLKGKGLNDRQLAGMLRDYSVKRRRSVRSGTAPPAKGYRREDLHDAWSRYLAPPQVDAERVDADRGDALAQPVALN
jgi:hypothetical protein